MATLHTLTGIATGAQEIRKSRFAAAAGPASDEAAARAFIAGQSDISATHNCWAWRIGQAYRFSDDGEPSGTAGKLILQAIDGQGLDLVAVVVTRWFGGILLGSGGLMRAYGGTAANCLREAPKSPLIATKPARLILSFGDLALAQARLSALETVQVLGQDFTAEGAELALAVHAGEVERVARLMADLTSGRAQMLWDD